MAEEFEITLRIDSENPEAVFRKISALKSVGPYTLLPRGDLVMHDRYYDTPDAGLRKKRYALRLRTHGRDRMLCLKGKEKVNAWGGIRRLEIEGPWSEEILEQVIRQAGVLHHKEGAFREDDPAGTLEGLSLMVIQSRQTGRTLIDIAAANGDDSTPIGEMALDRVSYEIAGNRFLHYELEVEAKGGGKDDALKGFVTCLQETLPGVLKRWEYNKLITGHALEALVKEGGLSPGERPDDLIPQSWYDSIERRIQSDRKADPEK